MIHKEVTFAHDTLNKDSKDISYHGFPDKFNSPLASEEDPTGTETSGPLTFSQSSLTALVLSIGALFRPSLLVGKLTGCNHIKRKSFNFAEQ